MMTLKLIGIGSEVGVVLPEEVLARMKAGEGDTLYLTEMPEGYHLAASRSEFEAQVRAARKIMKTRRGVLRDLAK